MRAFLSLLCLVVLLNLAQPAQAQLRDTASQPAPAALYDDGAAGSNLLSTLFSDDHFRMSHAYEMSMSSFGGNTASLGMYTNSMMWQFNQQWAARVDVSLAHSPFGGDSAFGNNQDARVFLRNAEVAYRPSENMEFRFQMRQSPYGSYMSPYNNPYGSAYGYRNGMGAMPRTNTSDCSGVTNASRRYQLWVQTTLAQAAGVDLVDAYELEHCSHQKRRTERAARHNGLGVCCLGIQPGGAPRKRPGYQL